MAAFKAFMHAEANFLLESPITAPDWPFGDVICKLSIFMQGVSVGASVFTLVAVATDRYFAVVRVPKGKINGKQATVIISVIWILSITVSVPQPVVPSLVLKAWWTLCILSPWYLSLVLRAWLTFCILILWCLPLVLRACPWCLFLVLKTWWTFCILSPWCLFLVLKTWWTFCIFSPWHLETPVSISLSNTDNEAVVLHAEYDPVSDIVSCTERWPKPTERAYYTLALFILLFVVPLLAIGYMYIRIATNIWYRPATIAVSTRSNTEQADAKKIWVIKMLVVVVILFIVCWLPLQIIALVTDFGHLSLDAMTVIYMNVYPACHWLFYFNSAMNPVVYGYYNKNLRRICNEKLRKHKAKKTRKTAQGVAYNLRDISQASHLLKKDTSVNTVQTMVNSTPD
ncbi:G-protein coupled receptor [Branchiostoma belcheri]|nr:G-protein coupled receptor [Branchiostoma belcheri]